MVGLLRGGRGVWIPWTESVGGECSLWEAGGCWSSSGSIGMSGSIKASAWEKKKAERKEGLGAMQV